MKILVTGGAGYIGSILVEQLLNENEGIVVLDNLVQGHREAVSGGAVFIQGDIKDNNLLKEIIDRHNIKAVIHMAAETVIARSMTDPKAFFHENVIKGIALLDTMLDCNVNKIIFSSSAAVYGEPRETPITEGHPEEPINSYGESKLIFERILGWYNRAYGLKFISVRYFNAAGASKQLGEDHDPESHLIPLVIKAALGQRDRVEVFGTDYPTKDGSCLRDYIHVVDLADAHILALKKIDEIKNGIYNLGSGHGNSVLDVIETARKVTGKKIITVNTGRRPGDPAVLVASPIKAKKELGWKPRLQDLEIIIKSAWEWHKNHPEGYRN